MKKFGKFIFGTLSVATLAAGAYYVYKNFIKKDSTDDFDEFEDDFEDDFEDFDTEEDDDADNEEASREYVSINITSEDESNDAAKELPPEDEL
ncbi:MAG TPA: hypothetical protein VJZ06_06075 [Mobilitalea sp.]|nr:hypothetical protein [Mobilitalea sp.]